MERLNRVLASALAVGLMATVSLSVVAQGAGVDYWNQVVKGSSPMTYQDLNDGATLSKPSDCELVGPGFFEHVNQVTLGATGLCWGGTQSQHSQGSPSAGATSTVLSQSGGDDYSSAAIKIDTWPMSYGGGAGGVGDARALGASVWTQFDSCTPTPSDQHYSWVAVLSILGSMGVYSNDCGKTLHLRYRTQAVGEIGSFTDVSEPGPKAGRWFMTALVWHSSVLTWYTGYQGEGVTEYVASSAIQPVSDGSTWTAQLGNPYDEGLTGYPNKGGYVAEWWGLGTWQNDKASALLLTPDGVASTGLSTGQPATWLDILNSFVPFAVKPGHGCIATTSGPQDCQADPTQVPAPLSGSLKKFQIGYLPIVDCGAFPTIHISMGISFDIPDPVPFPAWAICNAGNVINMAVNALIFCANVAIDLVMPDGSGLAVWKSAQDQALTHFPFGYVTSAASQLGAALGSPGLGSYGCSGGAGNVTSCGYSGGQGSFTFSLHPGVSAGHVIDMPALMTSAGMAAYQGWMTAVIYASFGIMLLRAARADMANKPE